MILPPAMLGILGGGQLGMMFTIAAKQMGYKVTVLDPDPQSPAGQIANVHLCASYTDKTALATLAASCAAITTEFENVSADAMRLLAQSVPVHPSGDCVAIAQDRVTEKTFIQSASLPTAPFFAISNEIDLDQPLDTYLPGILKTARLGYDGKGQAVVNTVAEIKEALKQFAHVPCILEKKLALKQEVSVVLVRTRKGEIAVFPPAENIHVNGILDTSTVPAQIPAALIKQTKSMAMTLIDALDYIGVLAIEFFVLADDTLIINEIAPRPHNSGHYTLDATYTSQFEQQVRAMCDLPPGNPDLITPCIMTNLLGDLWQNGEPDWSQILNLPNAKLHLYGKEEARPGRKMGHFTVLNTSLTTVQKIKEGL